MDTKIIELYSEEEETVYRKKRIVWNVVSFLVLAAALTVCVFFCVSAYRAETFDTLPYVIFTSIAGWTVYLTIRIFVIADLKAAVKHIEAIRKGEAEIVTGRFSLTKERLYIKKGIAMTKVNVSGNDKVTSLQIFDKKKKLFDADKAVSVKVVFGFITAYEAEV
ncbi:MAG: hypothetical protein K6F68_09175 [Clostridiales bacterium]|nr:hypothetical protein [Clostridiales bacterium]